MNYNIPVVEDIWSAPPNESNSKYTMKELAGKFFSFYGNNYQIWNHVISLHIGQWQERRLQSEQKHFSPAKERYVSSNRKWTKID